MIYLDLPWPPSVNSYWRHVVFRRGARVLISETGRAYRKTVSAIVGAQGARKALSGRLSVSIIAYPPDRRKRDLDNILKSLLDSLTHAGVIEDDGNIDRLQVSRGSVTHPGGLVSICIHDRPAAADWRVALGDAA